MSKGKNLISEIGKNFKENDATSAMNKIMEITRTLKFSEKRLFGEDSRCYCKYSQLQVLQLLLLFPCFMIKNAFNYSTSSLCGIADCGKDVFYRFLSREDYDWRSILINNYFIALSFIMVTSAKILATARNKKRGCVKSN